MQQAATVILVFLKPFEKGNVKTRLAATVGDAVALEVYRHLVDHTIRQLSQLSLPADVVLCYSRKASPEPLFSFAFTVLIQKGDDLGSRMLYALAWAHAKKYTQKLIIGTDCFELTAETLDQAIRSLSAHDVVVGPAADGGYYLLGMKEPHAELFTGIPWSTSETYAATFQAINRMHLDWAALKTLSDIDTEPDLRKYPSLCNLSMFENLNSSK